VADSIVGIDLGTSNSVVAVCDQGGNVKVLSDDAGFKVQPSVVSFHPNGNVIVGAEAKQRKVLDPKNTVYSAKRLIGRSFRSKEVQTAMGRMPYMIKEGGNQQPMIVTRAGEFAVPEISAIVLDHMRKLASRAMGKDAARAVVTVPASFTEAQRTATATAGAIAGMTVVRVLNEPTAAALAYGHMRQLRRVIAVYDFGGGTFDITILRLDDNVYEVLGTAGDTFLGGDDLDERVVDHLVAGFLAENRIDLRQNEIAMMRLRAVAEQTKIELSRRSRAIIKVDEIAYGPGGVPLNLQHELTRDQLVAGCVDVIDRTFPVCEESLRLASLGTTEIDDVVLVGGTTKMPYVRDRVAAYFGKAPRTDINPEEAVAFGAALQAAALERILSKRPSVRATGANPIIRADSETTGGSEITHADALKPAESITLDQQDSLTFDLAEAAEDTFTEKTRPAEPKRTEPLGTLPSPSTRPPMTKTNPGQLGDRPVQRGESIDRFEGRGNVVAPGAPIARMTKPGVPPPAPQGRTLHGLPSQQLPPDVPSTTRPRTQPIAGLGPVPGGQSPPPVPRQPPITAPGVPPPPRASVFEEPTRPAQPIMALESEATRPAGPDLEMLLLQAEVPTKEAPNPITSEPGSVPIIPAAAAAATVMMMPAGGATGPNLTMRGRVDGPASSPSPGSTNKGVPPPPSTPDQVPHLLMPNVTVLDVTPRAFGIATVSGYCEELIRRNARVPAEIRKTFITSRDRQQVVRIVICQGESRRLDDNLVIGDLVLDNLEARPRGETSIEVTFAIDASGILNVRARDARSGREQRASVDIIGAQSPDEVATSRDRLQQLRR
jgi:molecular chaperone DnaK